METHNFFKYNQQISQFIDAPYFYQSSLELIQKVVLQSDCKPPFCDCGRRTDGMQKKELNSSGASLSSEAGKMWRIYTDQVQMVQPSGEGLGFPVWSRRYL